VKFGAERNEERAGVTAFKDADSGIIANVLERFPFYYRVALLVGLMAVAAGVDFWRHGREASKHREYGFVLIAGMAGGLMGFVNDCITSSISPDYFILGKGLEPGDDLRLRAGVYGLKAGLSAGVISGAVLLFAATRKLRFSPEQARRMLQWLWMPVLGAVLLAVALPVIAGGLDPMGLSARLDSVLDAEQIARFRRVWWIHTGLYGGLAAGLAAMIIGAREGKNDDAQIT
jgi:hypothetical protein